jgi:hypothetical protein
LGAVAIGLIVVVCSAVALAYWVDYTNKAQQRVSEAMEDVAQAYAAMPWTISQINADIDKRVASGEWSVDTGNWLKARVSELRSASELTPSPLPSESPSVTISPTPSSTSTRSPSPTPTQIQEWQELAYYEHWQVSSFILEPFVVTGTRFRVSWVFGADEESKVSMNGTISKWINDTLISIDHGLLQLRLENQSHVLQSTEAIYYRSYGIVLSYDDCRVWDNIAVGSIFKMVSMQGNVFSGQAVFEGTGKVGLSVEPLQIYATYFGGSWTWNIIVEEFK